MTEKKQEKGKGMHTCLYSFVHLLTFEPTECNILKKRNTPQMPLLFDTWYLKDLGLLKELLLCKSI